MKSLDNASSSSRPHLTLYLPGIFSLADRGLENTEATPGIEALLARAESPELESSASYEAGLFALFGLRQEKETDLPVAAVTRSLDMGVIDNDWWLRADPVHLSLDRDRLILVDSQMLDISQEEANRLVTEIMEVFSADGWLLKAPRPNRWYLKTVHPPKITTAALSQVISHDVHAFLPQGTDAKAWHTTLNEIQIMLHTSTVNVEREQRGQLPINSLWFWGGGKLPRFTALSWSQVWSNEPISLALTRLAGGLPKNTPSSFEDWRQRADKSGEHLVVLTDIHDATLYTDAAGYQQAMRSLEKNWMHPLWLALKKNILGQVTLIDERGKIFTLTGQQARRWWRWRRPLDFYQKKFNRPHVDVT